MNRRPGFTLIELTLVIALAALFAGVAVAPIARTRDVLAVRNARAELAGLAGLARSIAITSGGASLVIDAGQGAAWIETRLGMRVGDVHAVAARHGVAIDCAAGLRVRYDALGIGRMSAAVVRVKSGVVTGTVTISAYGRVRQS